MSLMSHAVNTMNFLQLKTIRSMGIDYKHVVLTTDVLNGHDIAHLRQHELNGAIMYQPSAILAMAATLIYNSKKAC